MSVFLWDFHMNDYPSWRHETAAHLQRQFFVSFYFALNMENNQFLLFTVVSEMTSDTSEMQW